MYEAEGRPVEPSAMITRLVECIHMGIMHDIDIVRVSTRGPLIVVLLDIVSFLT